MNFPSSQERWLLQASSESEAIESIHDSCPLQDGEPGNDEGSTEGRRLDGLHRPEGCLPVGFSVRGTSEVPLVFMEGDTVQVPVSSIRSLQYTQGLYEAFEAGTCATSPSKGSFNYVLG